MNLSGKRIAFLVAHEFEDIELLYPLLRLSEEGAEVTVVTPRPEEQFHPRPYIPDKPITGRFGSTVPLVVVSESRYGRAYLGEADPRAFDAVIIPGGFSPDYLRVLDSALDFVERIYRKGGVIAAICHGPQVFISVDFERGTDILKGRRVTAYEAIKHDLINAGATFEDLPAIRDGNVVTGRVPDDLPEFCAAIVEAQKA